MPLISSADMAAPWVAVPALELARAWAFSMSAVAVDWACRALASMLAWVSADICVTWAHAAQGVEGNCVAVEAGTSTGSGNAWQAAKASSAMTRARTAATARWWRIVALESEPEPEAVRIDHGSKNSPDGTKYPASDNVGGKMGAHTDPGETDQPGQQVKGPGGPKHPTGTGAR